MRQKEGEQKKKVNKKLVKTLKPKIAERDRRRTQALYSIKNLPNAIFQRYRDVNPKIRLKCVFGYVVVSSVVRYLFESH